MKMIAEMFDKHGSNFQVSLESMAPFLVHF